MQLLFMGLVVLGILGSIAGLIGMERKAGGDKVRADLQPKLTACQTQVNVMGGQIKEQNAAVESLKAAGEQKAKESAQALKVAEVKAKVWQDNATRLQGVLTSRKPDGPKDCKSAWTEIRKP